jgi:hypothetical protein
MTDVARDLGASLFRLYLGGRTYLPEADDAYAHIATALHALTPAVDRLAGDLEHDVGGSFTEVLGTVHLALSRTAINLDRAGTALVEIAERYSRADEASRVEFDALCRDVRGAQDPGPRSFTRPPMPGAAQLEIPRGILRGA